ncbi:MAG: hypothetical protein VYB50_01475 [Candidatus Thermoplasmatota archaeon]|nr:hypothetical protein [Candidatus Thermoplasmatota archaeon]
MRELWPNENSLFIVLYDKFLFWSILVGIFAFVWMIIAVLRYRDGIEPNENVDKIEVGTFPIERHNFKLEMAWFIGPTILVLWVTYLAFGSMNLAWGAYPEEEKAFNVTATGYQWFWTFEYDDALTWENVSDEYEIDLNNNLSVYSSDMSAATVSVMIDGVLSETYNLSASANAMSYYNASILFDSSKYSMIQIEDADGNSLHNWSHIPVGHVFSTPTDHLIIPCDIDVAFNMHSKPISNDNPAYVGVQHSLWLPEWGMKEDLVPGLEQGTNMFIQPDEAGTFPIRCAEYCGLQHSLMIGKVTVVAREGTTCAADYGVVFDNKGGIE